ncbi:TetR/AcrR family transcriptional regulator [Nocardia iowensis]|uniref:TetR family transcriptional regulator n=1 Tax=Nocardia iowensis TaxID=204891 RepID=A0ABX8S2Y2_NOCIO|nr:TetR/AcrR family transcriptional regulator [Nocardia iowensis]QXN94231.1 TetR family transcriptional regulator [Nocardia iowensis]
MSNLLLVRVTTEPAPLSPAAEERRRQIVAATIEVLAESGYAQTSFAKIAKHAGLSSTRLISYHFSGKEELMRAVVVAAKDAAVEFIRPRVLAAPGRRAWLAAYIAANMDFMRERTAVLRALIELNSNARAAIGEPFLDDTGLDSPLPPLEEALRDGQSAGEFRDFEPHVMAVALRAAIDTIAIRYAEDPAIDVDFYAVQLATLFDRATAAESD